MTISGLKVPFYIKLGFWLICILALGYILHSGKDIAVPLLFSGLLAVLLMRPVEFLEKRKWCPRPLAIVLPLLGALAAIAGIAYFFYTQFAHFAEDAPMLKEKLTTHITFGQQWIQQNLKIPVSSQEKYITETMDRLKSSGVIGQTFLSITSGLSLIVLIPVFSYLFLYYREQITKFLLEYSKNRNQTKMKQMMHESHLVIESYLGGLMLAMMVVIILNIIGLSLLGIKYALLLAILAGVLNLIPYIGMLSATAFAMLLTLINAENPIDALWVGVTLGAVQLVDNYITMPMIVGSKVQINALVTILGVLIGGTVMGVPGMFLSIPAIAVIKVICDRIDALKPWGGLLGTSEEPKTKLEWKFLQRFRKKTGKATLRTVHHTKSNAA